MRKPEIHNRDRPSDQNKLILALIEDLGDIGRAEDFAQAFGRGGESCLSEREHLQSARPALLRYGSRLLVSEFPKRVAALCP